MSRSRAALLTTLRTRSEPTTIAALAPLTGLHPNTVREHLDALVRQGLVRRQAAEPSGRGRPAWLYKATNTDEAEAQEYAGLATALAATIDRTSSAPFEDGTEAGTEWGRHLARERDGTPAGSAQEARRRVVALLGDIGFAPEADASNSVVRLTQCPILEAARKYPEVVCGVHAGLAEGALAEYGADPEGTEVLPFAEPGACLLHLMRRPR